MKEKEQKVDISTRNEVLQRLYEFVERKGSPSAIAKRIGKSLNIFSNMIKRDTYPSSDVLKSLAEIYPDMDLHFILTGSESMHQKKLRDELKSKDLELARTIEEKKKELSETKATVNRYALLIDNLRLPGKGKGASSHPQVDREGFSEFLIKGIRKNMKTNNISLLSNSWKFTNPN